MSRLPLCVLLLLSACCYLSAQQNSFAEAQEKPRKKYFSLYGEMGMGYQVVGRSANLTNPQASFKYQGGLSVEFNPDIFRKREIKKISFIFSYNLMASGERISFLSYYDSPENDSLAHDIRLIRLAPSLKIKLRINSVKHKPFVSFGFVARELPIRRSIEVTQNGVVYFSKGNFNSMTAGMLVINSAVMALPILGPWVIRSYPEVEVGISVGKKSQIDLACSVSMFDSMNVNSRYWSYAPYRPDIDFGAALTKTALFVKIKYQLL